MSVATPWQPRPRPRSYVATGSPASPGRTVHCYGLYCSAAWPALLTQGDNDIAGRLLLEAGVRTDYQRRLTLLHNRRPLESLAGGKRIAIEDFGHMEVAELRKVNGARTFNG